MPWMSTCGGRAHAAAGGLGEQQRDLGVGARVERLLGIAERGGHVDDGSPAGIRRQRPGDRLPAPSIVVNSVVMKRSKTWTSAGSDAVTERSLLRLGGGETVAELRGEQLGRGQVCAVPLALEVPLLARGSVSACASTDSTAHAGSRCPRARRSARRPCQSPVLHAVASSPALRAGGLDDLAARPTERLLQPVDAASEYPSMSRRTRG